MPGFPDYPERFCERESGNRTLKGKVSAQDPTRTFSAQRRYVCLRGTEDREKRQAQELQRMREKGKGARDRVFAPGRTRDCLRTEETGGTWENFILHILCAL